MSYEGELYRGTTNFLLVFVLALVVLSAAGLGIYRWTAPQYEQVRREVWEQSQSRAEGVKQNLGRLRLEYLDADADHRIAIRQMVMREVAAFDRDLLPKDLREWVESLEVK